MVRDSLFVFLGIVLSTTAFGAREYSESRAMRLLPFEGKSLPATPIPNPIGPSSTASSPSSKALKR